MSLNTSLISSTVAPPPSAFSPYGERSAEEELNRQQAPSVSAEQRDTVELSPRARSLTDLLPPTAEEEQEARSIFPPLRTDAEGEEAESEGGESPLTYRSGATGKTAAPPLPEARPTPSIPPPESAPSSDAADADSAAETDTDSPAEAEESREGESTYGQQELTPEEQREVDKLKARDREVRAHEQAHMAAAGSYARGGPSYEYETGPDRKRYAVGGEVSIDTSPVSDDPEATIRKAQVIRRAAMAPAEPSSQDHRVAAEATRMESKARQELSQERMEEMRPEEGNGPEKTDRTAADESGRTPSDKEDRNASGADGAENIAEPNQAPSLFSQGIDSLQPDDGSTTGLGAISAIAPSPDSPEETENGLPEANTPSPAAGFTGMGGVSTLKRYAATAAVDGGLLDLSA